MQRQPRLFSRYSTETTTRGFPKPNRSGAKKKKRYYCKNNVRPSVRHLPFLRRDTRSAWDTSASVHVYIYIYLRSLRKHCAIRAHNGRITDVHVSSTRQNPKNLIAFIATEDAITWSPPKSYEPPSSGIRLTTTSVVPHYLFSVFIFVVRRSLFPVILVPPTFRTSFDFSLSTRVFRFQGKRSRTACRTARGTDTRTPENRGPITPVAWTTTIFRYSNNRFKLRYKTTRSGFTPRRETILRNGRKRERS